MKHPLKLLLMERFEGDLRSILGALGNAGFDIVHDTVSSEEGLRRSAAEGIWDVVLVDGSRRGFDAASAARCVNEAGLDCPVVAMYPPEEDARALSASREGVDEFAFSDRVSWLPLVIERVVREGRARAALRQSIVDSQRAELRHRRIFDAASVALFEFDLSAVHAWLPQRGIRTVGQLRAAVAENPHLLTESAAIARILDVNDTAVALFGRQEKSGLVGPVDRLLETGLSALWLALLEGLVTGGPGFETETSVETAEGRELHVLIAARLGTTVDDLRSVIVTTFDITAHRRLEAQVQAAHRMEAVGRLAAGVAHDFNNLLTVIQSYVDFLKEDAEMRSRYGHDVDAIEEAAAKGIDLTSQLLAFSRSQAQQLEVVDLNEVIGGIGRIVRRLIGEDVEVVVKLARPLGAIKVDPTQIEQIIMNLAANARDAMPRGGKFVIETRDADLAEGSSEPDARVVPAGRYVLLVVSDTGIGMDEETQGHIFEPFFTTKDRGKGTGLGLSTVYGIVRQSCGHLVVASSVGLGTTFRLYFPRADQPAARSERIPSVPELMGGTETILVVEDEELVRRAVRRILERYGYHVLDAGGCQQAVQLAQEHKGHIDAVLTDLVMPGTSGRELVALLAPLQPHMRVVYMSGYHQNTEPLLETDAEATAAYVQKPFSAAVLLGTLRQVLCSS